MLLPLDMSMEGEIPSGDRAIYELIERGYYRDAIAELDSIPQKTLERQALRHLAEVEAGNPQVAHQAAQLLLSRQLSARERILCLFVVGRSEALLERTLDGCASLRQAVRLATELNDATLLARAQSRLCSHLLRSVGIEAALPELPLLRKYAYLAGDNRTLVAFHCYVAEIEMKRGGYGAAFKHLRIADALVADSPYVSMTTQVGRLMANAFMLSARPHEALRRIRPVVTQLQRVGAAPSLVSALSTLAKVCRMMGDFDEAEQALHRILSLPLHGPARLAARDELLEIALKRGDAAAARAIADSIESSIAPGVDDYYWLWHVSSRAKWLLSENRSTEALELLRGFRHAAAQTSVQQLIEAFGFVEAEALIAQGAPIDAIWHLLSTLPRSGGLTLEALIEVNRIASLTGTKSGGFAQRTDRIRSVAFSAAKRHYPLNIQANDHADPIQMLHSAAALFSVPFHAELAAHEVAALLRATGSIEHVSLAARHEHDSAAVVAANNGRAIEIEIGADTERSYVVVAAPRPNTDSHLTLLAVQGLVRSAVELGLARQRDHEESSIWLQDPQGQKLGMVTAAEKMAEILGITRRVATSNVNVLFTGETGTGKELLARALHEASPRSAKSFIPFNCTAVARDMLDSQLFGYRRGAFTGAHEAFPGVIRAADGGTLFLDEIGEMSLEIQPKLLRFLESGEIHPLGEPKPIAVDVRVVAATNANLEQLVAEGRFREDLFYRLNVVRLQVPPLRERREEIPVLAQHFVEKFSRESQKVGIRLAEETMEYLVLYTWPGNVRQLANEIRRMVVLTESGGVLMPEHLSQDIAASRRTVPPSQRKVAPTEFVVRMDQPLTAAMEHLERSMIQYALSIAGERLEDAAQMLGLSRKGLYLKRQRLKMAESTLREELPNNGAATKQAL